MRRWIAIFALTVVGLVSGKADAGWPNIVQYHQALRQKGVAIFGDPALRGGTLKRIGANIITQKGGAAAVFSITDATGKTWAVRCFTRQPPHDRHEAIARAVAESGLGAQGAGLFPEFEYVKEGVNMGAPNKPEWLPIVKMSWVNGKKLDAHVESLVAAGKHAQLDQLAEDWRAVHAELRAKGIGHGDLQHGNVMVHDNGKLQLIDLDDMFVESFRGKKSGGSGDPSYAHPSRGENDFYVDVDNFSSLVIYTSLKALAHDPSLWHDPKIHITDGEGGGDNLIFQRHDFEQAGNSKVWKQLAKSPSPVVRDLAAKLATYASKHVSEVPPLEHLLDGKAWKPDGTVPHDWAAPEIGAADEDEVEQLAAPKSTRERPKATAVEIAPAAVAAEPAPAPAPPKPTPVTPAAKAEPGPGPNATPAEWAQFRMTQLKQKH